MILPKENSNDDIIRYHRLIDRITSHSEVQMFKNLPDFQTSHDIDKEESKDLPIGTKVLYEEVKRNNFTKAK